MNFPWDAIEGLLIYLIGSTLGFVWWMATITEQLKALQRLVQKMADSDGLYARKEDVAREMGVIEKQQESLWTKYDKLKERLDLKQGG